MNPTLEDLAGVVLRGISETKYDLDHDKANLENALYELELVRDAVELAKFRANERINELVDRVESILETL